MPNDPLREPGPTTTSDGGGRVTPEAAPPTMFGAFQGGLGQAVLQRKLSQRLVQRKASDPAVQGPASAPADNAAPAPAPDNKVVIGRLDAMLMPAFFGAPEGQLDITAVTAWCDQFAQ